MRPVNHPEQRSGRPPAWRWRVLLVLALLTGLFGMHALTVAGAVPDPGHMAPMAAAAPAEAPSASTATGCGGCAGGCGTGHVQHADSTCASGAVNGAPALPPLVADPVAAADTPEAVRSLTVGAPDGGRAPPSLAELQLLRI
ncbi:hypothetical protein OK074_0269 [Actinobacteria bacterium OK074]|nr:hypothetical protein OK074_0269 [Actinobacteria bacterium OK074]